MADELIATFRACLNFISKELYAQIFYSDGMLFSVYSKAPLFKKKIVQPAK